MWSVAVILATAVSLASCLGGPIQPNEPLSSTPSADTLPTVVSTPDGAASDAGVVHLAVINTSDEHGYIVGESSGGFVYGGAGTALAAWIQAGMDPRDPSANVILLSGGDNWTGPAVSTWFAGESTVEVMNAMGYACSTVGNHEFDFGQQALSHRLKEASFPYLGANVYREGTTKTWPLVTPYEMLDVGGVKVGIVGLALMETPLVTSVRNLSGIEFGDYEIALREWVPVVRGRGADIVIVQSHICPDDLVVLARKVADLDIDLFTGGHCHQSRATKAGGALVLSGTAHWRDYGLVEISFDLAADDVVSMHHRIVDVMYRDTGVPTVPSDVQSIIDKWNARAELVLGDVIGYTATGFGKESPQLQSMLVDSWLWAWDGAHIAISNTGGYREGIEPGDITVGDLVGVLPFENELYELEVQGADLAKAVDRMGGSIVYSGIRLEKGRYVLADGSPLSPDAPYRLLTTDYMYHNEKYPFGGLDPEPYETSIHWRQPVIDWIRAQHSSAESPLEAALTRRSGR